MGFAKLNSFGADRTACIFIISYDLASCEVYSLDNLPQNIVYKIDDFSTKDKLDLMIKNSGFDSYKNSFDKLQNYLSSDLITVANLTTQIELEPTCTLDEIYSSSSAKYKLFYKDKFVCFSPETFIKISNNTICTYPMKGTGSDKDLIINSPKELAEHKATVDLMIDDLSKVASDLKVSRFRYAQRVDKLWQISSEIRGKIKENWQDSLGDLMRSLLPAGSILGSPREKAHKILDEIESYNRGFYTGIFGIFDGENLDSAVLIRFVEKDNSRLFFKTGSGVTKNSILKNEFDEILSKAYIPNAI